MFDFDTFTIETMEDIFYLKEKYPKAALYWGPWETFNDEWFTWDDLLAEDFIHYPLPWDIYMLI